MKWLLLFSLLTTLLLTACDDGPVSDQDSPKRTQTTQPVETSTPTPTGSWEAVIDGLIYDRATEPGKPISGALIRYVVLATYFPGLQEGRPNETVSNELGEFSLPVVVHDTDSIKILVEAQGYMPYEERVVAMNLVGRQSFNIGLTSMVTVTVAPP
jgi:hypothetical protein